MSITIYHNPRCSKSRTALKYLEGKGVLFHKHLYLEDPIPKDILSNALITLGDAMIRSGEADYKAHIKGKNLTGEVLIKTMLMYPKTIERPLVVNGHKMALGRPLENIEEIL